MKIIRPYMKALAPPSVGSDYNVTEELTPEMGRAMLRYVEWCGRISHRSEGIQSEDSFARFLKSVVLEKGDWSIVEHVQVSVDAVVDRGITHEIVRHRIGAYTQESTRFVRYFKEKEDDVLNPASFIYPIVGVECEHCLAGDETKLLEPITQPKAWYHHGLLSTEHLCKYHHVWLRSINESERSYRELLRDGWKPQDARSIFPNALSSRIVITYNLRTWRHFFQMRTSAQAHPQMRQVTVPLLATFQRCIPVLYDDLTPNAVQIENMRKGR